MLVELRVRDFGVIEEAVIPFRSGLTALTGETGAGKTLILGALGLLMGGKTDPALVRKGARSAVVEGVFLVDDSGAPNEEVIRREVPRDGRSRALVDGNLATAAMLSDAAARRVEIHGQHAQQRLLRADAQREALDQFGDIDDSIYRGARRRYRALIAERDALGGDERARLRELDLAQFQLDEIDAVHIVDVDEVDRLVDECQRLAAADDDRRTATRAEQALVGDDGVRDALAAAVKALDASRRFEPLARRLADVVAEVADVADELRRQADEIVGDPERLAVAHDRRAQLAALCRKYGDSLEAVLEERARIATSLDALRAADDRAARIDAEIEAAEQLTEQAAASVRNARVAVASQLGQRLTEKVRGLGLAGARVEVVVGSHAAGEDVEFRLAANPGSSPRPLARVASGGELSRVMLALQLVLTGGPPTLVFDEVDAGIGGETAMLVGSALRTVASDCQVIVVTHLAQVAAHADHQIVVTKDTGPDGASTRVDVVDDERRVVELSRMMTGSPGSSSARDHARELLDHAGADVTP